MATRNRREEEGKYILNEKVKLKGLERQCLIGSSVAGFNHTRIITKDFAKGFYIQDKMIITRNMLPWELSQ